MAGERTEQATQHRREKARKDGDILHSRELAAAAGTLAGVMALGMLGGRTIEAWQQAFQGFLLLGAPEHWEPTTLAPTLVAMEGTPYWRERTAVMSSSLTRPSFTKQVPRRPPVFFWWSSACRS